MSDLIERMKSLQSIFPRASKSFLDANAPQSPAEPNKTISRPSVGTGKGKRGAMNKTEGEFALILEAMKRSGEIIRYDYEGITLRWNGVQYTPDFAVVISFPPSTLLQIKLIEVKSAFTKGKFERAIERFRHARTYWPQFSFELYQKQKSGWKQIL